jgi:type IV fimbrial biogenesis protein FimT
LLGQQQSIERDIKLLNIKEISMKNTKGFTLIELVITLAVMAILVSWGFPSLQESIKNNRMTAQNNEMVAVLRYARNEAIRRNDDISVLISASGSEWNAYVYDSETSEQGTDCDEPGQLRCISAENVTLTGHPASLVFNNRGYLKGATETDFGTPVAMILQHENCRGQNQRRRIDITATGHISSQSQACGS